MKTRGLLYYLARLLGDVNAVKSGSTKKMGKRVVNKVVGKKVVRKLWWR